MTDRLLALLHDTGADYLALLHEAPLDAPVRGCPGWALRDLAVHLGGVHGWVAEAVRTAANPGPERPTIAPGDPALVAWAGDRLHDLLGVLGATPPDTPTWHPFVGPQEVSVWIRRQAQETLVHTWDAHDAAGAAWALPPWAAADGVAEYFGVIVPRLVARNGIVVPAGRLEVAMPDAGVTFEVARSAGGVELGPPSGGADARLRGRAEALLLAVWGRGERPDEVEGDDAVAAAWFTLGGS